MAWWATDGSGLPPTFAPFPGFEPFPFYRGYSADFFDGKHFVMKGGSARTAAMHAAAELSQLVSAALSIHVRGISLRKPTFVRRRIFDQLRRSQRSLHACPRHHPNTTYEFAADVRAGLTKPGQKELPRNICMTKWVRRCSR